MWPVLVEFRSASSEGKWRKKDRRQEIDRRIAVKPKSADNLCRVGLIKTSKF